jgi:hypothetical protein
VGATAGWGRSLTLSAPGQGLSRADSITRTHLKRLKHKSLYTENKFNARLENSTKASRVLLSVQYAYQIENFA